jgi:pSer/pThr/pTyr-binding forkhead associated (FHA) protein
MSIGRVAGNDIVIPDPEVSRRHAEVSVENGQTIVRDLDSLNGTRVNGRLVAREQPLRENDVVSIGNTSFEFHSDVGTPTASEPVAPVQR